MSRRCTLSTLAAIAATALAVPAFAAAPITNGPAAQASVTTPQAQAAKAGTDATTFVSSYAGSPQDEANTKAFYDAVMRSARAKQAKKGNGSAAVTVVYSASRAPSFASEIARSTQIWNNAVNNVTLVEGNDYDFYYSEGNDPRGSYASTNGHGGGFIFLDYAQNEQYDSTRVTAHETGHVLGLPDHYAGPCSELMSGGGPGTSCTNAIPNSAEVSKVEQLWANGLTTTGGAFRTVR
ncbi:snapalysin [Kribbella deserti]|uniref:Extracellular small neutral protease n=1 Tax=Kribbella deserti TaxID=1926257 RepID=A0ABV6QH95_9ACTN